MVPTSGNHAVITTKIKTLSKRAKQGLRHGFIVDKTDSVGSSALLKTGGHLLNQALVDRRVEFQLSIAGEFKTVGVCGNNPEYAAKNQGPTSPNKLIQSDVERTPTPTRLAGAFNKSP